MDEEYNVPDEGHYLSEEFNSPYKSNSETIFHLESSAPYEEYEYRGTYFEEKKESSFKKAMKVKLIAMITAAIAAGTSIVTADDTPSYITCNTCNGNGICIDCEGSGSFKDEACDENGLVMCDQELCQGKGYFTCTYCDGDVMVTCDLCLGSGVDPDTKTECFRCKGSGSMICPRCEGEGILICDRCQGNGYNNCPRQNCNGGYIDCNNCSGSGKCPNCNGEGKVKE